MITLRLPYRVNLRAVWAGLIKYVLPVKTHAGAEVHTCSRACLFSRLVMGSLLATRMSSASPLIWTICSRAAILGGSRRHKFRLQVHRPGQHLVKQVLDASGSSSNGTVGPVLM
jgi:hypothetical protein